MEGGNGKKRCHELNKRKNDDKKVENMDSLRYLVTRGILSEDLKPKNIPTESSLKLVKSGVVFQQQTLSGIPYDVMISWLQKSIRLGRYDDCVYCMYQIIKLDKINKSRESESTSMFRSHLLNRLLVILSEDIGMADNITSFIYERYKALKSKDVSEVYLWEKLCEMGYVMCKAKKSRYTDWLIHSVKYDLKEVEIREEEFLKEDMFEVKGADWLDLSVKEVRILYEIYKKRGKEYGYISLVHGVVLSENLGDMKVARREGELLEGFTVPDMESNNNTRSIYNSAIDKHSYWGRRYLGRDLHYFCRASARLENYECYKNEDELKELIMEWCKVEGTISVSAYDYQKELIGNAVEHYESNVNGEVLLNVGTGLGKTKMSRWIYESVVDRGEVGMVVCPTLDILNQFVSSWREMIVSPTLIGIMASKRYKYDKSNDFNYEYINGKVGLKRYLSYDVDVGRRIIFTTYSSLGEKKRRKSLLGKVNFTIYDECHHFGIRHRMTGKSLFLSATPGVSPLKDMKSGLCLKYGISEGIGDGKLTSFRVRVYSGLSEEEMLEEIERSSKKTIVYSLNNRVSKSLYEGFVSKNKYYIDCKLKERKDVLKSYKDSERGMMFNCSLMVEGVDVRDCDSIYYHSGKMNERGVIQSLGRCLRLSEGKSESVVYMLRDVKGKWMKRLRIMESYGLEFELEEL